MCCALILGLIIAPQNSDISQPQKHWFSNKYLANNNIIIIFIIIFLFEYFRIVREEDIFLSSSMWSG